MAAVRRAAPSLGPLGKSRSAADRGFCARLGDSEKRRPPRRWWVLQGTALVLAGVLTGLVLATRSADSPPAPPPEPTAGLPATRDYHALLVSEADADRVLLGTHSGVYESSDGGETWEQTALVDVDAMNLMQADETTIWAAGHDVLALSADGGRTWRTVDPSGLPTLDIHAFSVDPLDPRNLYAAVAGRGLYESRDGGITFTPISTAVGGEFVSLVKTQSGELLAGDASRGVLLSFDGGRSWVPAARTAVRVLAVHPEDPSTVLAGGSGILLSRDGGLSFREVLAIERGVGPVAWAPSDTELAYAVGFDRVLYRSTDGGLAWSRAG